MLSNSTCDLFLWYILNKGYYLGFSEKTFLHFYNFRRIYTFTDLHFPHCTKSVIMLGERHLNWMRFCSLSTFLTSKRQEVLDSPVKNYYFFFSVKFSWFEMARGEFSRFLGSISGQTSIFGVKYLRDPQITPPPQGVPPPTTRDFCLVVGGGAPLNGGWRPLLWGPLTILPQNIVSGHFLAQTRC